MSLSVENLSFRYGKRLILEEVSLEVPTGKILALLGPNGTGKTTLLKSISQIVKPISGSSLVEGEDLYRMSSHKRAKYVAYVPQHTNSTFPVTVADAVMMGRGPSMRFSPTRQDKELVFSVIRRMELESYAFKDINKMSGGERQRVFIARALAQQPKLLLLDEPTSSMDLKNQLHTLELVRQLAWKEHLTVVISIHDLNLAAMFCDYFLLLKDRKRFAFGRVHEVLTEDNIRAIYGVETEIKSFNGYSHVVLKKEVQ